MSNLAIKGSFLPLLLFAIRIMLTDELGDQVPHRVDFNVGYYEGKQQTKIWLVLRKV